MKNGALKSFAASKKLKYGTLNLILISIVIVIAILLNALVTVLSDAFGWYGDMTEEELYTISDPLVTLLDTVSTQAGADIDIIFCCDKDKAEKDYANLQSGKALAYVHSTATQIADRLDNVSILYVDPIKEPEFMRQFTKVSTSQKPDEDTVIVARKDGKGGYGTMYRTLHASSFYTFSKDSSGTSKLYGYNGERIFASAVLSLSYDKAPTVYFISGHGENLTGIYIAELFAYCGFNVRALDLNDKEYGCLKKDCDYTWGYNAELEGVKPSDTIVCGYCNTEYRQDQIVDEKNNPSTERQIPADANAVIINQPKYDYFADETNKLHHYLLERKGTIMCFIDPQVGQTEGAFENLYKFIKDDTGVTVYDDHYIEDPNTSSIDGVFEFRGKVSSNSATDVYLNALKNTSSARPIFSNTGKLEIDEAFMSSDGKPLSQATVHTQPLFETEGSALYNGQAGKHTVMSVSSCVSMKYDYESGTTSQAESYFVVCAGGGFIENNNLVSAKYVNDDVILSLVHSTMQENVPVNLDFKTFSSYEIDITASETRTVLVCLLVILPLIVIAAGVFVIVRRKNR